MDKANDMKAPAKRSTIYFDPEVHRALRQKAADAGYSVSALVNEAVRLVLEEDRVDEAAFEERATEPSLDFERFVEDLKAVS